MLVDVLPLLDRGFSLIPLKPREKRPVEDSWTSLPNYTGFGFAEAYRAGQNVGVRLGEPSKLADGSFLHVLDIDVRSKDAQAEALAWLDANFPGWRAQPYVRSGGGSGRHIYMAIDRPFRTQNS